MELSNRLKTVAEMVTPGSVLADVGTDHAHIPIWLVQRGLISKAIAMDINRGPLDKANENIRSCCLESQIETRLCDGMRLLAPCEADTVLIAGMGGGLVIHILSDMPKVTASLKEIILQPQSELYRVREYLYTNGFEIVKEDMVFEDGKYYPMMKVVPPSANAACKANTSLPEKEVLYFGKQLLTTRHPVLEKYLNKEILQQKKILSHLQQQDTERGRERSEELQTYLSLLQETLNRYFGGAL